MCGDLCDTAKNITPGDLIGSVTAKVDCTALFKSELFYQPAEMPPQSWGMLPPELQKLYTYGGRVDVTDVFYNTAFEGEGMGEATVFSKEIIEGYISAWLDGNPADTYVNASNLVAAAADHVNVSGKTILVLGTQHPWLEAVLLSKNAKQVVTLEYGHFISEYPGLSFIRPAEFREQYLAGTLGTFDIVISFSSLEHSGLGRYGDALNPWGDILAVAQGWCVSKQDAKLIIGVPTGLRGNKDIFEFNAHRVYGPVMYPFLATNWKFLWPTREEDFKGGASAGDQPAYVFEKMKTGLWGVLG